MRIRSKTGTLFAFIGSRFEGEAKNKVWLCAGWWVAASLPSCVGAGGTCQVSEVGRRAGGQREPRARGAGESVTQAGICWRAHSSQREGEGCWKGGSEPCGRAL